jgi:hypothetical protein
LGGKKVDDLQDEILQSSGTVFLAIGGPDADGAEAGNEKRNESGS